MPHNDLVSNDEKKTLTDNDFNCLNDTFKNNAKCFNTLCEEPKPSFKEKFYDEPVNNYENVLNKGECFNEPPEQSESFNSKFFKEPAKSFNEKSFNDQVKNFNESSYRVQSGLKCFYTNADSLSNKLHELELFLNMHNIDVCTICETLPKNITKEDKENLKFKINGYECHQCNAGQGVCIFVRDSLVLTPYHELNEIFQPSFVGKLNLSKKSCLNIGIIYRSPNSSTSDNQALYEQMETISRQFKNINEQLIILGDFNYPSIDWSSETTSSHEQNESNKFLQIVQENYLQ